jgi:hypothetical protein
MTELKIVDDFLAREQFEVIRAQFMGDIAWYYHPMVADDDDTELFYFTHTLHTAHRINSNLYDTVQPIINLLNPKAIIRIKANLYTNVGRYHEHDWHTDFPYKHTAAIFYVNTNNGFTILEDGTKVESVANRLLILDGSKLHRSTTCTDEKTRVNIGFNYFSGDEA